MAVLLMSSAKGVTLEVSSVAQLRFVWQAMTCQKTFCVAGAILLRGFEKMSCIFIFLWHAQHFGDLHRHFAWQAQDFRHVAVRVFGESYCQGCVKW